MGPWQNAWNALRLVFLLLFVVLPGVSLTPSEGEKAGRQLKVLHITDVHLDLQYRVGSSALCTQPPCCRGEALEAFQGAGSTDYGGPLGNPNCDSPMALLESALSAGKTLQPDLVIWTGDSLAHNEEARDARERKGKAPGGEGEALDKASYGRAHALWTLANVTETFQRMLPNVPVFPVLGNYDFYPRHTDPGPGRHNWLTEKLAWEIWKDESGAHWLSEDARKTFTYGGFYKQRLETTGEYQHLGQTSVYVIGLNTEVCHFKNYYAFNEETNGMEQLAWLKTTLMELRFVQAQAILIGHIPPGLWSGCWGEYSAEYEAIVGSFRDVIAAQLYGHQHSGSFRILYEPRNATKASSVAYVTPSLSPFKNQYPSFRLYTVAFDGSDDEGRSETPKTKTGGKVSAFSQYYLDLSKYTRSALKDDERVSWYISFRAPQDLGLPRLSPESWSFVSEKLLANQTIRDDYIKLETNGRSFMGSEGSLRTYACGIKHVVNDRLIKCSKQNEEQFIRDYTGNKHTYVLTTLFSFDVLMERFCTKMNGFLPSDCKM